MKKTAKPIKANHAVAKDVSRAGSAAVRSPRNASKGARPETRGRYVRSPSAKVTATPKSAPHGTPTSRGIKSARKWSSLDRKHKAFRRSPRKTRTPPVLASRSRSLESCGSFETGTSLGEDADFDNATQDELKPMDRRDPSEKELMFLDMAVKDGQDQPDRRLGADASNAFDDGSSAAEFLMSAAEQLFCLDKSSGDEERQVIDKVLAEMVAYKSGLALEEYLQKRPRSGKGLQSLSGEEHVKPNLREAALVILKAVASSELSEQSHDPMNLCRAGADSATQLADRPEVQATRMWLSALETLVGPLEHDLANFKLSDDDGRPAKCQRPRGKPPTLGMLPTAFSATFALEARKRGVLSDDTSSVTTAKGAMSETDWHSISDTTSENDVDCAENAEITNAFFHSTHGPPTVIWDHSSRPAPANRGGWLMVPASRGGAPLSSDSDRPWTASPAVAFESGRPAEDELIDFLPASPSFFAKRATEIASPRSAFSPTDEALFS
mmetsp:Transcript_5496/g.21714  ORF Transcript_5496/g.21714 Transcript_5496/m.21714 type:complete len:497 (-) Transcript_5496:1486-2976(-)